MIFLCVFIGGCGVTGDPPPYEAIIVISIRRDVRIAVGRVIQIFALYVNCVIGGER